MHVLVQHLAEVRDHGGFPRVHHSVGEPEVGEPPVRGERNPAAVGRDSRPEEELGAAAKGALGVEVHGEDLDGRGAEDAPEGVVLVVPDLGRRGVLWVHLVLVELALKVGLIEHVLPAEAWSPRLATPSDSGRRFRKKIPEEDYKPQPIRRPLPRHAQISMLHCEGYSYRAEQNVRNVPKIMSKLPKLPFNVQIPKEPTRSLATMGHTQSRLRFAAACGRTTGAAEVKVKVECICFLVFFWCFLGCLPL